MNGPNTNILRYQRQIIFRHLGPAGQKRLSAASALIVGAGGLGSWAAELLARAGVGMLRLADADTVELTNIHRQALYDQADADAKTLKVHAAAAHLAKINRFVRVEPVARRIDASNVAELARGVELVIDGTDNFASRFLLNDYCVKANLPWIFAGVVGAEGQLMTVFPHASACLRCLFDAPPPPCADPSCSANGVLGPAVAVLAAMEACEAVKILSGNAQAACPHLLKMDLWTNQIQRLAAARRDDCPCCGKGHFEFLEPD